MKQTQTNIQQGRARLADVAPAGGLLTPMEELADRDLLLTSAVPTTTNYGPGYKLTLQELDSDTEYNLITSAVVVVRQLNEAILGNNDPFEAFVVQFQKSGRCWVIV